MSNCVFNQLMRQIVCALEERGYNPYVQLTGYLKTGDISYITRYDEARVLVQTLDKTAVQQYIDKYLSDLSSTRE